MQGGFGALEEVGFGFEAVFDIEFESAFDFGSDVGSAFVPAGPSSTSISTSSCVPSRADGSVLGNKTTLRFSGLYSNL